MKNTIPSFAPQSYTPVLTLVGGAGNTVPQYTTNLGRYFFVGGYIFVQIDLTGDGGNEGAGSGQVNISLPRNAGSNQLGDYTTVGTLLNGTAFIPNIAGMFTAGGSTLALGKVSAGNFAIVTGADQNNTTRTIRLSFFYEM